MEQQFASILRTALLSRWGIIAVVALLGLLSLHSDLKSVSTAAKKKKSSEKKVKKLFDSVSVLTGCIFVAVMLLTVWTTCITIPIVADIRNESYCSVHGEFAEARGRGGGYISVTTDDDEKFNLDIPFSIGLNIRDYLPPYKEYTGTIWYGENSQYALMFVPDKGDWRFYNGQDDWWDD